MSDKVISVNKAAARRKAARAGRRVASYVSEQAAEKGSAAKRKAKSAGRKAASSVARRASAQRDALKRKASSARKAAVSRLVDKGLEVSRKQQAALEKLKERHGQP